MSFQSVSEGSAEHNKSGQNQMSRDFLSRDLFEFFSTAKSSPDYLMDRWIYHRSQKQQHDSNSDNGKIGHLAWP
jgi:hypothetical protein